MLTLRIGWRNLWRNGKRTAITMAAVALNAAILIVSYSLMDGLWAQLVSNATNLVTGEAQLHAPGYLSDRSFYKTIPDPQKVLDSAAQKRLRRRHARMASGWFPREPSRPGRGSGG